MADEVKVEDWYDVDENNYARIHSYDLGLLIKQANGSYAMLEHFNKVVEELRRLDRKLTEVEKDRDRWRSAAAIMFEKVFQLKRLDEIQIDHIEQALAAYNEAYNEG
jgi:uncharacterized protein YdcH (DUF465 family)